MAIFQMFPLYNKRDLFFISRVYSLHLRSWLVIRGISFARWVGFVGVHRHPMG